VKAAITSSPLPEQAEINLKIEVKSRFNITSLVACQNVNLFLLFNLGNLVTAGEPILLIGEKLRWRVPHPISIPLAEFKRAWAFSPHLTACAACVTMGG
jgi:hypothetical protein